MKVVSIPSSIPTSVIAEAIKLYEFNNQYVVTLKWNKSTHGNPDIVAEQNGNVTVVHKGDMVTFSGDKEDIAEIVKYFDDGATDFIRDNDIEGLLKHYDVKKWTPEAIATDVKNGQPVLAQ